MELMIFRFIKNSKIEFLEINKFREFVLRKLSKKGIFKFLYKYNSYFKEIFKDRIPES